MVVEQAHGPQTKIFRPNLKIQNYSDLRKIIHSTALVYMTPPVRCEAVPLNQAH